MNNLYYATFIIILTAIPVCILVYWFLKPDKGYYLKQKLTDAELRIEAEIKAYNQSIHNQFDQLITLYAKPMPQGSVPKIGMLVQIIFAMHKKIEELEKNK